MPNQTNQNQEWQEVGRLPTWDFEKNKEMIGTLEKIETEVGPNKSMLYTFRLENGDLVKIWGSTILDQRLEAINIGDEIKIVYEGIQKSPQTGRKVKIFKVFRRSKVKVEVSDEEIPIIEE